VLAQSLYEDEVIHQLFPDGRHMVSISKEPAYNAPDDMIAAP
jgi:hypothetical protein